MFFFDTETYLVRPGLLAPPLVCVSVFTGSEPVLLEKDRGATAIEYALDLGEVICGHNVAYDLAVVCAYRPHLITKVFKAYREKRIRDTKVRQELLDIKAGRIQKNGKTLVFLKEEWTQAKYSLGDLILRHAGKDRSADKAGPDTYRLRYAELDGLPVSQYPAEAVRYALEDVTDTAAVYHAQGADIVNEPEQCQAAWSLHLMSCWGIRTEKSAVEKLEATLIAEQGRNKIWLHKAAFYKARRATPEEVADGKVDFYERAKRGGGQRPMHWAQNKKRIAGYLERCYVRRKWPVPATDSGGVSTDKDACARSGSRLLQLVSDGGGVDKILNTYVPLLKHGTQYPINARFNVLVNSGRTSCSAPNLQNLPTGRRVGGVRDCFVPRPGYLFVSVDYDTLELRALAQACLWLFGFSKMAEAIRAGMDLHVAMGANMLGISYEECLARYEAKDEQAKRARDCGKCGNFGLPGGLGWASLIDYSRVGFRVILSHRQAQEICATWFGTWPEMQALRKYVAAKTSQMGEADLVHFVSGRTRGGCSFTEYSNGIFQGLAADGAKAACYDVSEECYVDHGTALYGCRPVAFIHDEILAEVPEDRAHEAANRLSVVMCAAMSRFIPDVPITAKPALMRRWLKGAEPRYVNDRLVPWEQEVGAAA